MGAENHSAGAVAYRPTITQRIWLALGFCYHVGAEPEDVEKLAGWMCTETRMHFGFLDRLRLLISGRLHIKLVQHTPVQCDFSRNRLDWEIEPAGGRSRWARTQLPKSCRSAPSSI